jgi:nicotinamidase-related amidase
MNTIEKMNTIKKMNNIEKNSKPISISTCISAQPYDYAFETGKTALIVIDMQRDFIEPGGFGAALGNDVSQLDTAVPVVAALLDWARSLQMMVIHTRESHAPDLSDCPPSKLSRGNASLRIGDLGPMGRILIRGEAGNDIVSAVAPIPGEVVIDKPGKGAFYGTDLHAQLQQHGISHLLFAGVTTEVCVQSSMHEANDRGYECLLVEDATASYFPHFKQATLAMIRAQGGIVGWTATLAQLKSGLTSALKFGLTSADAGI